ncbi:uncharacterized protein LOC123265295 [Cotesia glomerata]|uniref:uncharacterized protein LOC123265295 n=1 Tax=Cotesia glomerata TaxID=32391 RepID=UPI001D00E194|nr:uncharacterized protein LOC123265295 [Cotesia glomerata]
MDECNASFTDCQVDVSCRACNVPILHKSVNCPKCLSCFHTACVNTEALTKNGGFTRCCGPGRGKSTNTGGTHQFTLEDIQQAFRDESTPLARRLDNVEIRLDNLDTYLKDFSTRGISEHCEIVKLKEKVNSIVSSASGAQSVAGASHDVFKEFEDRLRRRSNLMVYELPEDDSSESENGIYQIQDPEETTSIAPAVDNCSRSNTGAETGVLGLERGDGAAYFSGGEELEDSDQGNASTYSSACSNFGSEQDEQRSITLYESILLTNYSVYYQNVRGLNTKLNQVFIESSVVFFSMVLCPNAQQ